MPRSVHPASAHVLLSLAIATTAGVVWMEVGNEDDNNDRHAALPRASRSIEVRRIDLSQVSKTALRNEDPSSNAWLAALRLARDSGSAGLPLEAFEEQIAALPLEEVIALIKRDDVWRELPAYAWRLADRFAAEAPAGLAGWLDEIGPADPRHEGAAGKLLRAWVKSEPAAALDWLVRLTDPRERAALGIAAAEPLARDEPALAVDLLSAFPVSFDRDAMLQQLFHDWAQRSPNDAIAATQHATASNFTLSTGAVALGAVFDVVRARAPADKPSGSFAAPFSSTSSIPPARLMPP